MTRIILFMAIVLFNIASFAASNKLIVVVSEVKGNAFYCLGGKTKVLKEGVHLPASAEIFTEVGSQIAFNDYYDHVFYLSGGAHLIVYPNLVELKEGYLWIKSLSYDPLRGPLKVTTANSLIENKKGEGILSFDSYSGKTQVLSIKGDFDLKNIRQEFQWTQVGDGQFSFIQDEYNKGVPRRATPIGYSSYKKVTSLFSGVEAFDEKKMERSQKLRPTITRTASHSTEDSRSHTSESASKRSIASVSNADPFEKALQNSKGEVTIIKLRDPEKEKAHEQNLMNFYKNKVTELGKPKPKKKWSPSYSDKSNVKVMVFGSGSSHKKTSPTHEVRKTRSLRMPASIKPAKTNEEVNSYKKKYRTPASIGKMVPTVKNSAFESELVDQYKKQMRHEDEVNQLIDQLKSIDMDYKKEY